MWNGFHHTRVVKHSSFKKRRRGHGKSSPVLLKFEKLMHGSVAKRLESRGLGHVRRRKLNDPGALDHKAKSVRR